ncbi:MAG TPA: hypothetical protein VJ603_04955 [Paucimonas sp.]|nr:hypothetical protein [Paucimonas sp.]HJW56002.1 hypothetical protein [Burkholderiaceae bacterium]
MQDPDNSARAPAQWRKAYRHRQLYIPRKNWKILKSWQPLNFPRFRQFLKLLNYWKWKRLKAPKRLTYQAFLKSLQRPTIAPPLAWLARRLEQEMWLLPVPVPEERFAQLLAASRTQRG